MSLMYDAMTDERLDLDDVLQQKGALYDFVKAYRDMPELWDQRNIDYTNNSIRLSRLKKLVLIYQNIMPFANIADVRRKINILRSNYRKEMKRVAVSKLEGKNYVPTSWVYHAMRFLGDGNSSIKSDSMMTWSPQTDSESNEFEAFYPEIDIKPSASEQQQKQSVIHVDLPQKRKSTDTNDLEETVKFIKLEPDLEQDQPDLLEPDTHTSPTAQDSDNVYSSNETETNQLKRRLSGLEPQQEEISGSSSYLDLDTHSSTKLQASNVTTEENVVPRRLNAGMRLEPQQKASSGQLPFAEYDAHTLTRAHQAHSVRTEPNMALRRLNESIKIVPNTVMGMKRYTIDDIAPIVRVWHEKLVSLEPIQRLLAEKAINDILFEASFGRLKH